MKNVKNDNEGVTEYEFSHDTIRHHTHTRKSLEKKEEERYQGRNALGQAVRNEGEALA